MADARDPFPLDPPGLLGGLSAEAFLREHWQRRPLLVRDALPGFTSPLTAEELAGLACEEDVESRLVLERGAHGAWELRNGPFTEADFRDLPETHWTLLVQEVDRLIPAAAALLERFRFVPDWRVDDVMVSYAPEGGSVGPHVDSYDVFLLQGAGRRRWQVGAPVDPGAALVADSELRILSDFTPVETWELAPGDMLYLPPNIPHYGVALEPGQTWSIGFRSPAVTELAAALADELAASLDPELRYTDPGRAPAAHPGRLDPADLERIRAVVLEAAAAADPASWVGRLVTENRSGLAPPPPDSPAVPGGLESPVAPGVRLVREPGTRWAYAERDEGVLLFVDGDEWSLVGAAADMARALCDTGAAGPAPADADALQLLCELYNRGALQKGDGGIKD